MKLPFGWIWPFLAAIFTLIAIIGRTDIPLAVGAATVSVIAAGLALRGAVRRPESNPVEAPNSDPESPGSVRTWIRSGPLGREDLVLLLDRIERTELAPDLRRPSAQELNVLLAASEESFRRYLEARVESIEGTS